MRESSVQQRIRLDAAQQGFDLWRNNSGALPDEKGRIIRYGLGNDSSAMNKIFKSSDLIGPTPVFITPEMVGTFIGVFTAIEVKEEGWHMIPSDERAIAQKVFHDMVLKVGGYAGFAQSVEDYRRIIKR